MIDIRQTPQYARYLTSLGWKTERIKGINYFIKTFPIIGSVLKIQRPKEIDFKEIEKLLKKNRVFQIILEPDLSFKKKDNILLLNKGYKPSKSPYLPSKTIHLDLTKPLKFEKETRRQIRKGSGLSIKSYSSPKEIEIFRKAWKKSVNFKRFVPSTEQLINLKKCFPGNYSVFLASHNSISTIIGGAIFTRTSHGISYYWQAFTSKEGRTSLSQYSLLYQGILWAKKQGCKVFDFEGIYDPRFPNKGWLGFTAFKKSFGGSEVKYPGCFTKTYFFRIS